MHKVTFNIYEIIIGALIFGMGLLYLTFQSKAITRFIGRVEKELLVEGQIYQQYNDTDINMVSSQELCAIIMGNHDLPIIIDGRLIEPDGNDYDQYFSYIKAGIYRKSYGYDTNHNIVQLVFEYAGL